MITLALDTATARCTVAVSDGTDAEERHIDGPRLHAGSVLRLTDELLSSFGASVQSISKVITGDGPGSFTGLRVSASVAKALLWDREAVVWEVAPSLRIRGLPHLDGGSGTVLALSDALRGELYAGCWRFTPEAVEVLAEPEGAVSPESLTEFGEVDLVVGSIPEPLRVAVAAATGIEPIIGEAALPNALALLKLSRMAGGTQPVHDATEWQPRYGRPAEAQAVWERKHGRPLPAQTHRRG